MDKADQKTSNVAKTNNTENNNNNNKSKAIEEEKEVEENLKLELFRKQRESEQLRFDPDEILDEQKKRQPFCEPV